jgi:hypothetical protein
MMGATAVLVSCSFTDGLPWCLLGCVEARQQCEGSEEKGEGIESEKNGEEMERKRGRRFRD